MARAQQTGEVRSPGAASLTRRLLAAAYDAVLVVALWLFATALLLPFTGGEAIEPGNAWYALYLAGWALAFFAGFWLRGGQTLGMRAWRIRLVADGGGRPRWHQAILRFAVACLSWACLGLGYWWALLRRDRRTWHDLASGTRLEQVEPPARKR